MGSYLSYQNVKIFFFFLSLSLKVVNCNLKTKTLYFINVSTKWWDSYRDDFPELKIFAIRILSLTCSSSGCESNWSEFGIVRTNDFGKLSPPPPLY